MEMRCEDLYFTEVFQDLLIDDFQHWGNNLRVQVQEVELNVGVSAGVSLIIALFTPDVFVS
jgi:hypothetical protein